MANHEDCTVKELMEANLKTMDERFDSLKENIDIKFTSVNANIKAGNDMLLLKIQEIVDSNNNTKLELTQFKKDTGVNIAKLNEDVIPSAWVKNNPKLAIGLLLFIIICAYVIIQKGYVPIVLDLLK